MDQAIPGTAIVDRALAEQTNRGLLGEADGTLKEVAGLLSEATGTLGDVRGLLVDLEDELEMLKRLPAMERQLAEIHATVIAKV